GTTDGDLQSIHTDEPGQWSGSVLWNDNHVAFENGGAKFETKYGTGPLNDIDTAADQLFTANDGATVTGQSANAAMVKAGTGTLSGAEN
ncbi:MAG: hypothetical protein ACPG4Q_11990, partial [Phycisphaeraceae bacterium]